MTTQTAAPVLGQFQVLSIFKEKMLMFLDSLIEMFPEQGDLIVMRMIFSDQMPIDDFLGKFSTTILPYRDMISERNDNFFLSENNPVFMNYGKQSTGLWKVLWQSNRLDEEDKQRIWKWLDLFMGLSEMYDENRKRIL